MKIQIPTVKTMLSFTFKDKKVNSIVDYIDKETLTHEIFNIIEGELMCVDIGVDFNFLELDSPTFEGKEKASVQLHMLGIGGKFGEIIIHISPVLEYGGNYFKLQEVEV